MLVQVCRKNYSEKGYKVIVEAPAVTAEEIVKDLRKENPTVEYFTKNVNDKKVVNK